MNPVGSLLGYVSKILLRQGGENLFSSAMAKCFGEVHERKGKCNSGRDNSTWSYQRVMCPGYYKQLIQTLTQFEYTVRCIYSKMALDSLAGFNYEEFLYLLGSLKDHSWFIQEQMQIHIEKIHIELILTTILKTK